MSASPQQVLAVDDDAVIALDMRLSLQALGLETTIVSTGAQALRVVRQQRFDLIILNIHLPDINGLEVCRQLKLDPDLQRIPVIFASGETSQRFKDEAFRLGAADYLPKPYEPEQFKARVLAQLTPPHGP